MSEPPPELPPEEMGRSFFHVATAFELSLAILALGIGWLLGHDPLTGIAWQTDAWRSHAASIGWGLAAVAPMAAMLVFSERLPFRSLEELQRFIEQRMAPYFKGLSLFQMAVISLAAGFGEEALFRGLIQEGIKQGIGGPAGFWAALVLASIIFGLCHFLTPMYFVVATVIGVWLGLLLEWTGDLTAPIVTHAAYDFFALWWLTRRPGAGEA